MASSDDDLFGAEHVSVYRETGGEHGYNWRGTTILLLTTTGHSSGQSRTTPLIHRTDGGRWVVVASKGGAPEHPAWYENLLANPQATIQVRAEEIPVAASTAAGAERHRLWALVAEVWPGYDDYQEEDLARDSHRRADAPLSFAPFPAQVPPTRIEGGRPVSVRSANWW